MHGYGEFTWVEKKKYCGFYKYDKKDGFGLYYWPDNKFFIGFWKEGKQNGFGKYIKNNDVKYGLWRDGKKEKMYSNDEEEVFFKDLEEEFEGNYVKIFKWDIKKLKEFMDVGEEEDEEN